MSDASKVIRASFLETEEHFLTDWERTAKKSGHFVAACIGAVVAGLLLTPEILRRRSRGEHFWWIESVILGVAGAAICWWMSPAGQRRQVRRALRKTLENPPTKAWFEFSDAGFLSTGKGGRSSFHPWSTIPEATGFPDGLSIVFDKVTKTHFWIPRSAFESAEDYESLHALVSAKVPGGIRRRP